MDYKNIIAKMFSDLDYSNTFKDLCKLLKTKEMDLSGFQLDKYINLLKRYEIDFKVLDMSWYFKICILE